ncbi:hypothetical protein [Bordetella genomosp. 6]|uniref:hypothetical protein n=1 Tax=Bordetella genomosp. 6 TaxID=463024 RepID=UPI003D7686D0
MNWIYTWYSPHGRLTASEIADHMAEYALNVVHAAPVQTNSLERPRTNRNV